MGLTMNLLKKYELRNLKEIRLFNIPILQFDNYKVDNTCIKKISIFPKSFEQKYLEEIIKIVPEEHDFIYIVRTAGIGEAYLLNFIIDELNQQYKAKNPCIVSNSSFFKGIFELYTDIPFYHVPAEWERINLALLKREYKYKGKSLKVYHCTFEESMNLFNNKFGNDEGEPYPNEIMKMSNATVLAKKEQYYSEELKEEVKSICPYLHTDNFIFLNPEQKSVLPLSDTFWQNISSQLREKGYDVFFNTKNGVSKWGPTAKLDIAQAAYLASRAKAIISVRCGFCEVVSSHKIPKYVIYTPHILNPVSATQMLHSSTLLHYPQVEPSSLFEYSTDELSEDEIIDEIMKGF